MASTRRAQRFTERINDPRVLGMEIARDFFRLPTVEALVDRYGMSRASAYRWRRAWSAVFGETSRK